MGWYVAVMFPDAFTSGDGRHHFNNKVRLARPTGAEDGLETNANDCVACLCRHCREIRPAELDETERAGL